MAGTVLIFRPQQTRNGLKVASATMLAFMVTQVIFGTLQVLWHF